MRAEAAISLSVSAEWSRENDLMTARPLARPPMASRRALFFTGMAAKSISVCEEMGSARCRARHLALPISSHTEIDFAAMPVKNSARREAMGGLAKGLAVIKSFSRDHSALTLSEI